MFNSDSSPWINTDTWHQLLCITSEMIHQDQALCEAKIFFCSIKLATNFNFCSLKYRSSYLVILVHTTSTPHNRTEHFHPTSNSKWQRMVLVRLFHFSNPKVCAFMCGIFYAISEHQTCQIMQNLVELLKYFNQRCHTENEFISLSLNHFRVSPQSGTDAV